STAARGSEPGSSSPANFSVASAACWAADTFLSDVGAPIFAPMNAVSPAPVAPLVDLFGRSIAYVRVSVTDRCDFRCVYCMSEDMNFLPKRDILSLEELDRLCSAFVGLGVRKLRITGGEPLVRRN